MVSDIEAAIIASRPYMPDYGIAPASGGEGLLPWQWAQTRLTDSHNYWLSTVTATGAPHTTPVWAIWHGAGLVFSAASTSRKVINLQRDERCTMTTENASEAVVVEGRARVITDQGDIDAAAEIYLAKYGMGMPPDSAIYRVLPVKVFGFIERDERFTTTATRWQFNRSG